MNYESTAKNPTPFKGLSVQLRRRLVVYLCYIATPAMTPDEVRQRWGEVLSADDWPLAHEAMDLIDEIKKELVKRKRRSSIRCVIVWTALISLFFGMPYFLSWESLQTVKRTNKDVGGRNKAIDITPPRKELDDRRKAAEEAVRKQREENERTRNAQEEARIAKVSAEGAKQDMLLQCDKAKSAGAKEHAIPEWNGAVEKWNAGDDRFKIEDYSGASALYNQSESLFVEAERIAQSRKTEILMAKASVERAKIAMQQLCSKAKSAGAKEHAIPEWNGAVEKWNAGDDRFKIEDYSGASALYNQAGSLFVKAERISKSRKTSKLTAELSDLQGKAAALVEESDKWWKWSVDETALLAMGDEINKTAIECNETRLWMTDDLVDELKRVAEIDDPEELKKTASKLLSASDAEFSHCVKLLPPKSQNSLLKKRCQFHSFEAMETELKKIMLRCYELSSNNGNAESSYRLYLIYGGAQNIIQHEGIKNDAKLATKYLKRAADKGHPLAKKIYDQLKVDPPKPPPPSRGYNYFTPSRSYSVKCAQCHGTGFRRKTGQKHKGKYVPDIGSDTECPACRGKGGW